VKVNPGVELSPRTSTFFAEFVVHTVEFGEFGESREVEAEDQPTRGVQKPPTT